MTSSNPESYQTPCMTSLPLEAAQPKSAKIETFELREFR